MLDSIAGQVDEIVLVDGGSKDGTAALAKARGCKVFHNPWPGYTAQRQFADANCTCAWVLVLDSDEEMAPGGIDAIRAAIAKDETRAKAGGRVNGYKIKRSDIFLGQPMPPLWQRRLYRRRAAAWDERKTVHEHLLLEGGKRLGAS